MGEARTARLTLLPHLPALAGRTGNNIMRPLPGPAQPSPARPPARPSPESGLPALATNLTSLCLMEL